MAGTGYFDANTGVYRAKSVETWDDYTSWTAFTSWKGTPVLPLEFTTEVTDYGSSTLLNFAVECTASDPFTTTLYTSDSIDSAGALVSPTTTTVSPGDTVISAIKARYWQFKISIDADSAAVLSGPDITSIQTSLSEETVTRTFTNIDTSTLDGVQGVRTFPTPQGISTITSMITQVQNGGLTGGYVNGTYVASGYYTPEGDQSVQLLRIEKSDPVTLHIYEGGTANIEPVDCVFDAIVTGLPGMSADALGNISIET